MSPTLWLTLFLKVAPPIVPERPEQKPAPVNSRLAKSQTSQDPVASTQAPRQLKPALHTSGSQTKARASNFDGGPVVPHIKNLSNNPTLAVVRPQPAVSRTTVIKTTTKDDTKPAPTQQISSGSSASGTSTSPKKNKHKKKKVCHVVRLSSSGALTSCNTNRFRHRKIQQLKQVLHRKVRHRCRTRSWNHLLSDVIW